MDSVSSLDYIVRHVVLPPKLPHKDDSGIGKDTELLKECEAALTTFRTLLPLQEQECWRVCIQMVKSLLNMRDVSGHTTQEEIKLAFEHMTGRDVLAFHVRGQNAGLIVRRQTNHVSFESFELSPVSSSVMGTKGRLRRCFPGPAIALDHSMMSESTLCDALAQVLAKLDVDTPLEAIPVVSKARSKTTEIRDTVHPKFITEMFTGILRGMGRPHDAVRIHKCTRDDVVWSNALKPWRRSPLWLLIRVALQTTLVVGDSTHTRYKSFMIFFVAYILRQAIEKGLPNDILFVMTAKISRRTLKLATGETLPWMNYVKTIVQDAHRTIAHKWHSIERNPDPLRLQKAWNPSLLSFQNDTQLSLLKLQPYLGSISARLDIFRDATEFKPRCSPRFGPCELALPWNGLIQPGTDFTARLLILDFECWVETSLDNWLNDHRVSPSACAILADLIRDYTKSSASIYAQEPESISLMLLVSMELWIALDKCVIYQYPIIKNYEPGFPTALFDPLLLPKRMQLDRLARVEQYMDKRKRESTHPSSLVFEDLNEINSLAVQFFQQSAHHQHLRHKIESAATIAKSEKIDELRSKTQEYQSLKQRHTTLAHSESWRWNGYEDESYHPSDCLKCQLKRQAESLEIKVHEWPLPHNELETKATVFELDVPAVLANWREITYALIVDVFSPDKITSSSRNKNIYSLHRFDGLRSYFESEVGRLNLASIAKPFINAHYGSKKIPLATNSNICVNNGLHYSIYDSHLHQWTSDLLNQCGVWGICTFQLPPGPYHMLQYAVNTTTHTSNEALANQSECPKGLNLHEFYAFSTLRSGNRLQWRNIAREVVTRNLKFNHEETFILIVQSAWQVGCAGEIETYRESHIDLEEEDFGSSLLFALENALETIEGNWQGAVALRSFIVLAIRLLSMSPHHIIHRGCIRYLKRARNIAIEWARDVGRLLHEEQDEEALKVLNMRALEMALTCCGTFDVDQDHLAASLEASEDIAVVTECCIIVHDRCPAITHSLPQSLKALIRRHERLSHFLEPHLRKHIIRDHAGIENTIQRVWSGYCSGSTWMALPAPNERWLATKTSDQGGYSSVTVHYNILDGSLLVNGSPLTRLPLSYEIHPTYRRILGEKVLDVVPSTMRGMIFESRKTLFGQQVHFRMIDTELIIKTRNEHQVCELIPISALDGDFPSALVQDFAHFLIIGTGQIEWRPISNIWESSPENWQMRLDYRGVSILSHGQKEMIDLRSPTAKAVTALLNPLEHATFIHISLDGKTGAIDIQLPRLKLDFTLKTTESQLTSKQFRGMSIDPKQCFGAFTGLASKLVLRSIQDGSRRVIIPHGDVTFLPEGDHVKVNILTGSDPHVKYHSFYIDDQLGRLVDNGNLQSRLFRLYLHATTSHCLSDNLTGRTGTEESLDILRGAATKSFIELQPEVIELLGKVAQLTPRRQFYPEHLQVMQRVEWQSLSPLSQHCEFALQVELILEQAKSYQIFSEHSLKLPIAEPRGKLMLQERAAIRDSSFQVDGFGAGTFNSSYDHVYKARDSRMDDARELSVCRTAKLVNDWSQQPVICRHLLSKIESWSRPLCGSESDKILTLGFDLKWLDVPAEIFPQLWCSLHDKLARSIVQWDKYKVMVFLSTLSYSVHANQEIVQTLLAFATIPTLQMCLVPSYPSFDLTDGYEPVLQKVVNLMSKSVRPFQDCPESHLPNFQGEKKHNANARRKRSYQAAKDECVKQFAMGIISQWPTASVQTPTHVNQSTYITVEQAMKSLRPHFESWYRNAQFREHIQQKQNHLDTISASDEPLQSYTFQIPANPYIAKSTHVSFGDLTGNCSPLLPDIKQETFDDWLSPDNKETIDHSKLHDLLGRLLARGSATHELRYIDDLRRSYEALHKESHIKLRGSLDPTPLLHAHMNKCRNHAREIHKIICDTLQLGTHDFARIACMVPRLSPISLLSRLDSVHVDILSHGWKSSLVQYGLSITALQRAGRLLAATGNAAELLAELENHGHCGWSPLRRPEWLLLEIENNMFIREEQAQIAQEMIMPSSGSNSVMQLNMGLGKSSVIVPIAAAALADRSQLVRVIVLKPLAMQMFQLLVTKLGGLLNRRVIYMPISRSLNLSLSQALLIRRIYEESMRNGSIVLIQPEHILSFELMGFEHLLSHDSELGNAMTETQDWLHANSRDILDESDEILSVRFELIYTMGIQRAIDFSPDRWIIVQHVLDRLGRIAPKIREQYPNGLEVMSSLPGTFPRVRILESKACDELLGTVAQQLCEEGLPGVPVWSLPQTSKVNLLEFLTDPKLCATAWKSLQESIAIFESMRNGILLLKGLFAGGILRFALKQKRWRVNFGLDLSRTLLAVPYHAKDTPSPRAEFSHPDATIVLTCLSYYYGGLTDQQLRATFDALLGSDHAQEEYALWVKDAPTLPAHFKHLGGINLSNPGQCAREVFPPLRFARSAINFHLSAIVFPAEMKEFPNKLSSSGWDIARNKSHPTTGFSGTNDSRYVLPLSINQCDRPAQLSTNAAVLDCLLRPENTFANVKLESASGSLDAVVLLEIVLSLERPARVILDVGAQVLELHNEEFAKAWLLRVPLSKAQAVIFFDASNEICVLTRDGSKETLLVSPFAKQIDQCLIYLDESHTRGTDLKLPADYRAIVTLGPNLTKDRLVQACMRMRKLGKGQSVIFCGSMEIQRKILDCSSKSKGPIEVSDVLQWCMKNTCTQTRKSIPLWATQGIRHQRRYMVPDSTAASAKAMYLLEPEAQSLEQRYSSSISQHQDVPASMPGRDTELDEIRAKCQEFEVVSFDSAALQEEQERELSPENEREQQVELPPKSTPYLHQVHRDVRKLIVKGVLARSSEAFCPAFESLRKTSASQAYESAGWTSSLLVTSDFARTIQAAEDQVLDSFLRPVHWIISCKIEDTVTYVVVSPYEAQELLPSIRQHKKVVLHVYSPRTSLSVRSIEDLSFCAVPAITHVQPVPTNVLQLNLFAGQLYFQNFEDYVLLCGLLGLSSRPPITGIKVGCDGFIDPSSRAQSDTTITQDCSFTASPVPFIRRIMVMRRKGLGVGVSHIGKILNGELVGREHF